jgi:Uma2 family endonuclease
MGYAQTKLTAAEFLAWEATQTERHFFLRGEVFAMAGGTAEHNEAAGGFYADLKQHLKGTPCKTFMGDMRLYVQTADAYFYPDVVVTCDPRDTSDPKISTIVHAKLVIEVLSPSTAIFDRGAKFAHYRTLDSLQEYVLVDPETKTLEVFRKNASQVWELHPSDATHPNVRLNSVDWVSSLNEIFA